MLHFLLDVVDDVSRLPNFAEQSTHGLHLDHRKPVEIHRINATNNTRTGKPRSAASPVWLYRLHASRVAHSATEPYKE